MKVLLAVDQSQDAQVAARFLEAVRLPRGTVLSIMHVFNCRSERLSLFQLGVGTNRALVWAVLLSLVVQAAVLTIPVVAPIFKVAPLPIEDWVLMGSMGLLPFVVMESIKLLRRR